MASTRLPGKPLASISGIPMVVRVWKSAVRAGIGPVVVAAAEPEITSAVEAAGGQAVLTDPNLASGSDRVWAALKLLDPQETYDVIVNLQGDLPDLDPMLLTTVVSALEKSGADIATLAVPISDLAQRINPAVVKVIASWGHEEKLGRALYFTRATAPSGSGTLWHHIGIYAYRRKALENFVSLPYSPLEKREKLEQLRALEAGIPIAVAKVDACPLSVDTQEDLEWARRLLK